MINKIKKVVQEYDSVRSEILKKIGYESGDSSQFNFDYINYKWDISEVVGCLRLFDTDEEYEFTLSSYGSKKEKFYYHRDEDYTYVMCYPEHLSWDNTEILILTTKNEI